MSQRVISVDGARNDSAGDKVRTSDSARWPDLWITIAVLVLPLLATLSYVAAFSVEIPMEDDWDFFIPHLAHVAAGQFQWSDINVQNNDGLVLVPEIAVLLMSRVTSYPILFNIYLSYFCIAGCLLVLYLFFRLLRLPGRWSVLWFLPVSVLFMGWRQSDSLLQSPNVAQTMAICFALASLYCCTQAYRVAAFFPAAVLCAWLGSFSFVFGLFVWPLGAIYFLAAGASEEPVERTARYLAGWLILAGTCGLCFFFDHAPHVVPWPTGPSFVFANLKAAGTYLMIYLGSGFSQNAKQAEHMGILLSAIGLPVFLFALCRTRKVTGLLPVLLLVGFVGIAAAGVVQSRLGLGIEQAFAPRYVIHSVLATIGVYFSALALMRHFRLFRYVAFAFAILMTVGSFRSYTSGLADGRKLRAQTTACAQLLKDIRHGDKAQLTCTYPDPNVVLERLPMLEQYHLSLFRQ
jgi:hypothetical protein